MLKYLKRNNLSPSIPYDHGGLYSIGADLVMMIISAKLVSDGYNWLVISHDHLFFMNQARRIAKFHENSLVELNSNVFMILYFKPIGSIYE
jgi:hypothetical protein